MVSNGALKGNDFIVCGITSKKSGIHELEISNKSLSKGSLPLTSYIRVSKVVSLHSKLVKKVVAKLKPKELESYRGYQCTFSSIKIVEKVALALLKVYFHSVNRAA